MKVGAYLIKFHRLSESDTGTLTVDFHAYIEFCVSYLSTGLHFRSAFHHKQICFMSNVLNVFKKKQEKKNGDKMICANML